MMPVQVNETVVKNEFLDVLQQDWQLTMHAAEWRVRDLFRLFC